MNIRRIKKPRTKHTFSLPKIKTVFLVHVRFTAIQIVLALFMYGFLKTENHEPLHFIMLSLATCGFFAFPAFATKEINRLIRQNEYTGIWGNWLFQTTVCLSMIRFVIPFEQSYLWINTFASLFVLSIILLLLSIKRSSRKLFSNLAK